MALRPAGGRSLPQEPGVTCDGMDPARDPAVDEAQDREAPVGEADGLNDAAELQRGGCPEQSDVVVKCHLVKVLMEDDRADRILGLVLPSPLHGAQPNQGQQLLPAGGWTEGTGCKEKPGANSACLCSD